MFIPEMKLLKRERTFTGYENLSPGCCCIKRWKKLRDEDVSRTLKEIGGMKREEFKPFMHVQPQPENDEEGISFGICLGGVILTMWVIAAGLYFQ